jgi:hypothetical protein
MASRQQATDVKKRHSMKLLSHPGVSGVGVEQDDTGDYVLAVHLDENDPQAAAQVPEELEGVKVRRIFSGPFKKY